jgi:hypothetical protein
VHLIEAVKFNWPGEFSGERRRCPSGSRDFAGEPMRLYAGWSITDTPRIFER